MQAYLVGGAVRDKLLGRKIKDRDFVVVGSSAEEMLAKGYLRVGNDFPVFLHPDSKEEYALARTEKKAGSGYNGFICDASSTITLEQDLQRRDLTINAMAMTQDGLIVDPYGGQQDLQNRVLRHVSNAFSEDPLRVLRVARFAARYHPYGFTIAEETQDLMRDMCASGELDHLTAERVWHETQRSLMEDHPQVYFETLRCCGALKIWFPELDALWGVPNPAQWHPEIDTGVHTMMVLEQVVKRSDELEVRFAALVHDLGKALTPPHLWPSHRGHETLGIEPINALSDRLKVPNACRQLGLLVSEYHTHIHRAQELKPATILNVFDRCDAWRRPERFEQLLSACHADANGRLHFESSPYPQADLMRAALAAAKQVEVSAIINAGYQGAAIKEQLQQQRIKKIRELLETQR